MRVSLTDAGSAALEAIRAQYGALLGDHLDRLSDERRTALAAAAEEIEHLVDGLQRERS